EEEPLLALEPRLIHQDAVEALAGEFPTTALDEPEMRRERAEIAVAKRRGQPIEPERWIPARVEARDFRKGSQAHTKRCPRIGDGTGNLEMLVHSLPRHEQMHDLAGPLEDQIDAAVAQEPLDADGRLTAPLE